MNSAPNAPLAPENPALTGIDVASRLPSAVANAPLFKRNSFGFDVQAEWALSITSAAQLQATMDIILAAGWPWRVLGGGSNVILPSFLPGITLLMDIAGQAIQEESADGTLLSVGAGVNWHEFVTWTLDHDLPGLENLALIPGTVGAAPIQNIGAYGLEVGEYIQAVEAFDCATQSMVEIAASQCHFAYRDSIFKANPKRYIITRVDFVLPKAWSPRLHYADLAQAFSEVDQPSPEAIFVAVCRIRNRKLPDPKLIGNAGSFFQNPIVSHAQYEQLLKQFPNLVSYPEAGGQRKLAAGWMIDHCGFKGVRAGSVGVYENQALVLVHYGQGDAKAVLELAKTIQDEVHRTFGIDLLIEPIRY